MSDPYKPPAATTVRPESAPVWLPYLWNPIVRAMLIAALVAIETVWFTYSGEDIPQHTAGLWGFCYGLLLAWWVRMDRGARGMGIAFEFDAFVVFLWPLALPYYLWRTRGVQRLLPIAAFGLLYMVHWRRRSLVWQRLNRCNVDHVRPGPLARVCPEWRGPFPGGAPPRKQPVTRISALR